MPDITKVELVTSEGTVTVPTMAGISEGKTTHSPDTTTKAYVTGTTTASENAGNQIFDTGIYLTTTAGRLHVNSLEIGSNIILT